MGRLDIRNIQILVSGINLVLGLGPRLWDPCVYVVFWALTEANINDQQYYGPMFLMHLSYQIPQTDLHMMPLLQISLGSVRCGIKPFEQRTWQALERTLEA